MNVAMNLVIAFGCAVAAGLLTYALYSTLTLGAACILARARWIRHPETRLWTWRIATLAPLGLTLAAIALPTPAWLPTVSLLSGPNDAGFVKNTGDEARNAAEFTRDFHRAPSPAIAISPEQGERTALRNQVPSEPTSRSGSPVESILVGVMLGLVAVWGMGVVWGMIRLRRCTRQLRYWVQSGQPLEGAFGTERWRQLCQDAGVSGSVPLLGSPDVPGPLAGGWWQPFVIVPELWFMGLAEESQRAILAHELAHVRRGDAWWNLLLQLNRSIFFFQPLHSIAIAQARLAAEYEADREAVRMLDHPADLARSLIELAERLLPQPRQSPDGAALTNQMSLPDGDLRKRVVWALDSRRRKPQVAWKRRTLATALLLSPLLWLTLVPRIQMPTVEFTSQHQETSTMRSLAASLGVVATLWIGQPATLSAQEKNVPPSPKAIAVPAELQRFSGMMIGKLVDRDIERGSFTVTVDYVARVWPNNKSRSPRAAVGKTFQVEGVAGKWLDQLLLIRPGETIEFEAQHREGDAFRFPGEWLKKVAPYDPAQHPVPPKGFRGFSGLVVGKIDEKRLESRELVLTIRSIERTFEKNRAKNPADVKDKQIVLAGFWARMSKPFDPLKKGDVIEVGVNHRVPQSDHFTVIEYAKKVNPEEPSATESSGDSSDGPIPAGMRGFRGILRGTLISRDVEKGTLEFRADKATRVWRQNRARDLKSCQGKNFLVTGISGKWVDVLLTLKPGDKIEVEAFHNGQDHLDFVKEHLQKAP